MRRPDKHIIYLQIKKDKETKTMGEVTWYVHKVNKTTEGKENKTVSSFSTKKAL